MLTGMTTGQADRAASYETQPMLRLLDCYVLDVMGVLDEGSASSLQDLTPRLAQTFGVEATTWQRAVEQAMHLPDGMREEIAALWERNLTRFAEAGQQPDPLAFAYGVVDDNLR